VTDIIDVNGLRQEFGPTTVLRGIDLHVAEGEVFGILGPNGAGKTTTVSALAGLLRPTAGTVRVAGVDPAANRIAATRLIGVQLQQAGLQPKLRVGEAIDLFASFHRAPLDGRELAGRLGLHDHFHKAYETLSGGQQQRLAIVLALVGRPRVALLDELTTGLDPVNRRAVWEVVEELRADGTTVVLVSHLLEEVQRLCDRVALLEAGRVKVVDTPAGLVAASAAPVVVSFEGELTDVDGLPGAASLHRNGSRVEVSGTDDTAWALLDLLRTRGVRPERLRISSRTLDDAYLDLVGTTEERITEDVS
jgi:ABC-2 type transport system ATP-binding protein